MDLRQASSQLILAFEDTKEFRELKAATIELRKSPQNKKALDDLRQLQKRLQDMNLSEQEASRVMSELSAQYNKLQDIPEFNSFFDISNKFDHLFEYVTGDIAKNLDNSIMGI